MHVSFPALSLFHGCGGLDLLIPSMHYIRENPYRFLTALQVFIQKKTLLGLDMGNTVDGATLRTMQEL